MKRIESDPYMKGKFLEQTILFISLLKWLALGTGIGLVVGASTALFLKILNWGTALLGIHPHYFFFMPIAFFLSALLVYYLAPQAKGHGTEKVIEAIHKRAGKIEPLVVPVKLVATLITLWTGGSAGKEGPCAQIGAGLASQFARLLRFDEYDRKKLVICGISAGFASVFGTPIAGAIFGVEVLFVGSILYDVLLPSFIAGIISYHVSSNLGIQYFYHPIQFVPVFGQAFFLKVILAGVFFGLCSVVLVEVLGLGEALAQRIHLWKPLKGIIGGLILIGLTFAFSTRYLGLGLNTIDACIRGETVPWYTFLVKAVFTSITLGFEGSGGIITPVFFMGAASGNFFGRILGMDVGTFSALGVVGLLAGAANTPIAASIMAIEFFGPNIGPSAAIVCVISYIMTGHRSIYPSQVLASSKAKMLQVETGKEIIASEIRYKSEEKSLIGRLLNVVKALTKKWRKI